MPDPPGAVELLRTKAAAFAAAHAGPDGIAPGLGCFRAVRVLAPSGLRRTLYRPVLSVVLQGAKRASSGEWTIDLTPGRALVLSFDRPIVSHVYCASAARPHFAMSVELEPERIRRLARETDTDLTAADDEVGPASQDVGDELLDALRRLLELAERTRAAAALLPGLLDEVHYWLLSGPSAPPARAPRASGRAGARDRARGGNAPQRIR